jgi:hypothetical protein
MQKLVVEGIILVLITFASGTMSVGEQIPAPLGELRVVDKSPLNWVSIVYNTFEHLMELDQEGTLVPRLACSGRRAIRTDSR